MNSESHCVYFYIKIKPLRCLDGALNNRGGHMKEEPASWHLHLPGAVGVQKSPRVQQDQQEHQEGALGRKEGCPM